MRLHRENIAKNKRQAYVVMCMGNPLVVLMIPAPIPMAVGLGFGQVWKNLTCRSDRYKPMAGIPGTQ
jgi:hypothetical protein